MWYSLKLKQSTNNDQTWTTRQRRILLVIEQCGLWDQKQQKCYIFLHMLQQYVQYHSVSDSAWSSSKLAQVQQNHFWQPQPHSQTTLASLLSSATYSASGSRRWQLKHCVAGISIISVCRIMEIKYMSFSTCTIIFTWERVQHIHIAIDYIQTGM